MASATTAATNSLVAHIYLERSTNARVSYGEKIMNTLSSRTKLNEKAL